MRLQRIKEGVAVKFVVAFDADFQSAVAHSAGHAEQHIAIVDLAVVQRHLAALIDLARRQFGSAQVMQPPYLQP